MPLVRNDPVEIASGVWVIPDGGVPFVPNVGFVDGTRSHLVIDTGMGIRSGQAVLEHAQRLANGKPLILTITHFHPEHGYGAQVFAPESMIVYNRTQLDELHEKGYPYADLFRNFGDTVATELEGFEVVEPDIVYDGEADIDLGGRIAQLRSHGGTHTKGDSWVFVPGERILFTGDLVEDKGFAIFPYFPPDDVDVNGDRWIEALKDDGNGSSPRSSCPATGTSAMPARDRCTRVPGRPPRRDAAARGRGRRDRRDRRAARSRDAAAPPRLGAARVDRHGARSFHAAG